MGLEPTTARLRAARSTDWARKATDITFFTFLFFLIWDSLLLFTFFPFVFLYVSLSICVSVLSSSFIFLLLSFLYVPLSSFFIFVLTFFLCFFVSLFSLCGYHWLLFTFLFLRKLPWLSRQSDRLLTDRSLVRSQAEASFLQFFLFFFCSFIFSLLFFFYYIRDYFLF